MLARSKRSVLEIVVSFVFYNFHRIHNSIRVTPAMHVGITDHLWELVELLA